MHYNIRIFYEKVNIITQICQYNNVILYFLYLTNYISIIVLLVLLLNFITNVLWI